MGLISQPRPVKLFAAILCSFPPLISAVEESLVGCFGPTDLRSESFPFDSTTYYDEEMGAPLARHFVAFERLISPESLAQIKIRTNELEERLASGQSRVRRPVNIDPGYLEESKLVLASTKNFSHRILIGQGIYAEVTMHFERKEWRTLPWTFPDFRTGRYNSYFTAMRNCYRRQLKAANIPAKPETGSEVAKALHEDVRLMKNPY